MSFEVGTRRRPAGFGLSTEAAAAAQELSEALPTLIREDRLRAELDGIPVISMASAV